MQFNKTILFTILASLSLSAQAQTQDAASLPAAGRAVVNKRTGEKIDLACLETPVAGEVCKHFQLRYTDAEGKTSMLGSEVIMKTLPEDEFQKAMAYSNKNFHRSQDWEFDNLFPILHLTKENPGSLYALGAAPLVVGFAIAVDTVKSAAVHAAGLVVMSCAVALPAVDLLITVAPFVAIGVQRGVLRALEKTRAKKIKAAVHTIFDTAETSDTTYLLKNRQFNLLKSHLTYYMN